MRPAVLQVPLEGGGWFVVRPAGDDANQMAAGPVRTGRVTDRMADGVQVAALTLQAALAPVAEMSRAVLAQLSAGGPRKVQVEFGVELTAESGAVIAHASGGCHLTVTLEWERFRGAALEDGE